MPAYTYFLAHAGSDTARARELRDHLHPDVAVFLDAVDLRPGDPWDIELPRRQRQSLATVALVSDTADAAYYLREEMASAIAFQRHDPDGHRLIPVFLDGIPADPGRIPYGLRVRHALDAARLGLAGVAAELKRLAPSLGQAGLPPPHPAPAEPPDRFALYEALCRLIPVKFDVVLFYANAPKHELAPASEPLARRALDLVQWAEQESPMGLDGLVRAIRKVAPGVLR
jgi:hypothetical protein